jgi:hypothetical protein
MKEVLFDFEEFRRRAVGSVHTPVHYSFRTVPSPNGMFVSIEFNISVWEGRNEVLVFETYNVFGVFEKEDIKAYRDDCMKWAREVGATPGYYEEDTPVFINSRAKEVS